MSLCINRWKQQGYSLLPNEEEKFAEELLQTVEPSVLAGAKNNPMSANAGKMLDTAFYHNMEHFGLSIGGSYDVGDVSWIAPMGQIMTFCAPLGVQLHTWQATASFGSSIGLKGMHYQPKSWH